MPEGSFSTKVVGLPSRDCLSGRAQIAAECFGAEQYATRERCGFAGEDY